MTEIRSILCMVPTRKYDNFICNNRVGRKSYYTRTKLLTVIQLISLTVHTLNKYVVLFTVLEYVLRVSQVLCIPHSFRTRYSLCRIPLTLVTFSGRTILIIYGLLRVHSFWILQGHYVGPYSASRLNDVPADTRQEPGLCCVAVLLVGSGATWDGDITFR